MDRASAGGWSTGCRTGSAPCSDAAGAGGWAAAGRGVVRWSTAGRLNRPLLLGHPSSERCSHPAESKMVRTVVTERGEHPASSATRLLPTAMLRPVLPLQCWANAAITVKNSVSRIELAASAAFPASVAAQSVTSRIHRRRVTTGTLAGTGSCRAIHVVSEPRRTRVRVVAQPWSIGASSLVDKTFRINCSGPVAWL